MAELRKDLVEALKGVAGKIEEAVVGRLKDIEVVDVGDVEVVRVGSSALVSLPKGKDEFFIIMGRGFKPPSVQKLSSEVV